MDFNKLTKEELINIAEGYGISLDSSDEEDGGFHQKFSIDNSLQTIQNSLLLYD